MPTISGNQEQGSIGLPGFELGNDRGCKERQHPVQHDEKQGHSLPPRPGRVIVMMIRTGSTPGGEVRPIQPTATPTLRPSNQLMKRSTS